LTQWFIECMGIGGTRYQQATSSEQGDSVVHCVWGLEVGGFLDFSFGDSASVVH